MAGSIPWPRSKTSTALLTVSSRVSPWATPIDTLRGTQPLGMSEAIDAHDPRLAPLDAQGRSTATTITSIAAVRHLRSRAELPVDARKLLPFTDNRQDASLQSGHLNDFVGVALLRAGLWKALSDAGEDGLRHDSLASKVVEAMNRDDAGGVCRVPGVEHGDHRSESLDGDQCLVGGRHVRTRSLGLPLRFADGHGQVVVPCVVAKEGVAEYAFDNETASGVGDVGAGVVGENGIDCWALQDRVRPQPRPLAGPPRPSSRSPWNGSIGSTTGASTITTLAASRQRKPRTSTTVNSTQAARPRTHNKQPACNPVRLTTLTAPHFRRALIVNSACDKQHPPNILTSLVAKRPT